MARLKLLMLDDYEGELAKAPALPALRELADVSLMNRPLSPDDDGELATFHVVFALRERTTIDAAFFERFPNLEFVLQSGGHAYHLDREAATERGIVVALGRGAKNPMRIMPELTWALILGLNRRLVSVHRKMAHGEWPDVVGASLHGKTLGILGYGRHGKPIANIARAFGMKIAAWDRGGDYADDEADVVRLQLPELMATADVVSVHLRLSDESRGLISRDLLYAMKPTALFINTARGAIVDESALVDVLTDEGIAGAGLDVFANEPLPEDSPLRSMQNVILTPHIGWKVNVLLHEWVSIAVGQLASWKNRELDPTSVLNTEAMQFARSRFGGLKTS